MLLNLKSPITIPHDTVYIWNMLTTHNLSKVAGKYKLDDEYYLQWNVEHPERMILYHENKKLYEVYGDDVPIIHHNDDLFILNATGKEIQAIITNDHIDIACDSLFKTLTTLKLLLISKPGNSKLVWSSLD
jgi:hypothetical protein